MDNEGVKYKISLEDYFSQGIKGAHRTANAFESTVSTLKSTLVGLAAAVGIVQFGRESVKQFEEAERAKVQLDNALKNRDVGFTLKELTEQADAYGKKWIFSNDQIMAAQVALTKFKNVSGDMFKGAQELAINIASQKGGSVDEWINTVGRALNDPTHASRLLRPLGIALTDVQEKMIKRLVETGKSAKAQDMIFQQLNKTFAGSADAAARTAEGMKKIAAHKWEDMQETFGKVISDVQVALMPAIDGFTNGMQRLANWVVDHGPQITGFFVGIKDSVKALFGLDISGSQLEKSFGWLATTLKGIHTLTSGIGDWFGNMKRQSDLADEMIAQGWQVDQGGSTKFRDELMRRMAYTKSSEEQQAAANKKRLSELAALKGKNVTKAPIKPGGGFDAELGAGISEPKASRIQNITITMNGVMEGWKVQYANTGEGVADFKSKLLEALNSVVQDAAIIATE